MQDNLFSLTLPNIRDTRWCNWLRHCAKIRKVACSIPDCTNGIFYWHNPSGHTMALGSTHSLTEMSTKNISLGGKGGRCLGLTTLPPFCADCLEIWESHPPVHVCNGIALPLPNIMPITRRNANFSWPTYIHHNTDSLRYINILVSNDLDVPSVFCKYRSFILWNEIRESIVRVATRPQAGRYRIWIPAEKNFFSSPSFRHSSEPQTAFYSMGPFLEEKRSGRDVNHWPLSSTEVKNDRSYTSTQPVCLHGMDREFTLLVYKTLWLRLNHIRDKNLI